MWPRPPMPEIANQSPGRQSTTFAGERHGSCSAVLHPNNEVTMRSIRHILHPTDFSSSAETATDYAIELAAKFQAELTLLHVYTLQIYIGPLGESYPLSPETVHKIQDDSERALDKIRQRASSAGVRARTINTDGIASNVIVATAQEAKADLIVIGTHGRTGIKHFLLGSVAEQVLRRACCPVLTVREDAGKER